MRRFLASLVITSLSFGLAGNAWAQYEFTSPNLNLTAPPSATNPVISGFTVSGLAGVVNTTVTVSSVGSDSLTSCKAGIRGSMTSLTISTSRGQTYCTGTMNLARGTTAESLVAEATNSANLVGYKIGATVQEPARASSSVTSYAPVQYTISSSSSLSSFETQRVMASSMTSSEELASSIYTPRQETSSIISIGRGVQTSSNTSSKARSSESSQNSVTSKTSASSFKRAQSSISSVSSSQSSSSSKPNGFSLLDNFSPTKGETVVGNLPGMDLEEPAAKGAELGGGLLAVGGIVGGVGILGGAGLLAGAGIGLASLPIVLGSLAIGGGLVIGGLVLTDEEAFEPGNLFINPSATSDDEGMGENILALGAEAWEKEKNGNPYSTGLPEIDTRLGAAGVVEEVDPVPVESFLTLKVAHGKGPGGATWWGTATEMTNETTRMFQGTMKGASLKRVYWQASLQPAWEECTKITKHKHGMVSALEQQGNEEFPIDFSPLFTPAMKNGTYNGDVTYYIRLVGESGGGCANILSNTVTVTVSPLDGFLELINPNAPTPLLYTTGTTPFSASGEFDNSETNIHVDWEAAPKDQTLHFIMANDVPRFGRWQVAVIPFDPFKCIAPSGLVATKDVDLNGVNVQKSAFTIPFADLALNTPDDARAPTAKLNALGKIAVRAKSAVRSMTGDHRTDSQKTSSYIAKTFVSKKKEVTYYVRYIGLNPGSGDCATSHTPSTTVAVHYGPTNTDPITIKAPQFHTVEVPAGAVYQVVKAEFEPVHFQSEGFNPSGHYVYIRDYTVRYPNETKDTVVVAKGTKIFIPPPPSSTPPESFFDKLSVDNIINGITEFVKAVIDVINFVADTYNGLKNSIATTMAKGLSGIGIPCDAECIAVLEAGLSVGQAALGIPPSIPNFDQMMDEGIDYLAKEAAGQVAGVGVPGLETVAEEVMKEVLQKTREELSKLAEENNNNSPLLIVPDPDYLYRPAKLALTVKNVGSERGAGRLTMEFIESSPIITTDITPRNVYKKVEINIPPMTPNETLTIPVQLEEHYAQYAYIKGDVDPQYLCTGGDCSNILSTPEYALGQRKGRWMQIFNAATPVQVTIITHSAARLPVPFVPSDYGYDTSGWKKISNAAWEDTDGVLHTFTATNAGGIAESTVQKMTVPANQPFAL